MDKYREQRRFWGRVVQGDNGCWLWIGAIRDNGYGSFAVKKSDGRWTYTTAQRFAFQDQCSEIPEGYEIDHLCRVRSCVRPDHLEAVTVQENRKRRDLKQVFDIPTDARPLPVIPPRPTVVKIVNDGSRCPNGHEYAIVGKLINGFGRNGTRRMTCAACRKAKYAQRRKGNSAGDRSHCPQGHPYSGENLWERTKYKNGKTYQARECRACIRLRNRLADRRKRQVKLSVTG